MKVLFLYLKAFSFTGGIEKFNRCLMKAMHELFVDEKIVASAMSSYDSTPDERYFFKNNFKGWGGNRIVFVFDAIRKAVRKDVVIIGHINLATVGYLIKLLKPSVKIVLIIHGIEAWSTQTSFKKKLLEKADVILAVSHFTKQQVLLYNPFISEEKITVFPNTIDPYFEMPADFEKPAYLQRRYGFDEQTKTILTVTRLFATEKYKGYDSILYVLKDVCKVVPNVRYLLMGKADEREQARIQLLITQLDLSENVLMGGFIPENELIDHYLLADTFVMPSKKEGFGIVFIEAMICGRHVIAGHKDGSRDALMEGEFGTLIDPDNLENLKAEIVNILNAPAIDEKALQEKVYKQFGFPVFKERLLTILDRN